MIPPALALSLFATAFYLVANGLQDVFDPHMRRQAAQRSPLTD